MHLTVNEFAARHALDYGTAMGVVKFLEVKGKVAKVGSRKNVTGKGKPSNIYDIPDEVTLDLATQVIVPVVIETPVVAPVAPTPEVVAPVVVAPVETAPVVAEVPAEVAPVVETAPVDEDPIAAYIKANGGVQTGNVLSAAA